MDWSDGEYEPTAKELEPASVSLVASLGDLRGKRVLDLGCGTGNAALEAARRGADVLAIDPAERLVAVARRRAGEEGLPLAAEVGEAAAVPAPDRSFDAVVSVFAVIFAPDADAAAREMLRVVKDDGLVLLTTWTMEGAIAETSAILRAAMAPKDPASGPSRPGPMWGDRAWVEALFAKLGGAAEMTSATLRFEAPSARAWLDRQVELHPVWRFVHRHFEDRPELWADLFARMLARLEAGNEASSGWAVTSRYNVVTARRA